MPCGGSKRKEDGGEWGGFGFFGRTAGPGCAGRGGYE